MILVSNGCHGWFGYKVVEHIPPNEKEGKIPIQFAHELILNIFILTSSPNFWIYNSSITYDVKSSQ